MEKIMESGENRNSYNWDRLRTEYNPMATDYMYVMTCSREDTFKHSQGNLTPYGNIQISPFAGILNYGQGLFEGLKAYRGEDNQIRLFRPELNALRMQRGAERLCMPAPSVDQFVEAVKQTALANKRWVPPAGKGTLYLRPLLMGSGPTLGPGPAPEYTFLIYACPVGTYIKGALNYVVDEKVHRAMRGGTGNVKSISNYSPVFKSSSEAKGKGFSDALFLDADTGKFIEEGSTCNIFVAKGNLISTPPLNGNILPGNTRKSIIEIATDNGYQVEERPITVEELLDADEAFCTGTAIVVTPISSVTYRGNRVEYTTKAEGATIFKKLSEILIGIQSGVIEDKKGWTIKIA
ncbi:branched-chain-amino-acid aminotransferase 2, chloroplastic-like [Euphorbia lathyris]|uniref:branched-chain-amino-acid aminotransferase 2, chloroplastic-like n=1 Tax=Euphorbia lathyris TaxID=212925 RepID=UPI003313ABE4